MTNSQDFLPISTQAYKPVSPETGCAKARKALIFYYKGSEFFVFVCLPGFLLRNAHCKAVGFSQVLRVHAGVWGGIRTRR
jgi:hypothetical protein